MWVITRGNIRVGRVVLSLGTPVPAASTSLEAVAAVWRLTEPLGTRLQSEFADNAAAGSVWCRVRKTFGRHVPNPLNRIGHAGFESGFRASGSG